MMAVQTRVMTAKNLPPLPHFSGEGNLVGEESLSGGWNILRSGLEWQVGEKRRKSID